MRAVWHKLWHYKKWLIFTVVLAVAATAGMTYYEMKSKPAFSGTTISVQRGDIAQTVSATGTIAAVNSVDVSSKITGLITSVEVKENEMVKAGQIMVQLEDTSLKTQVEQALAQLKDDAANYERSKELYAIGGESAQQLDADQTNYEVAQATYDNAVSQLDDTIIRAPIDGQVIGQPIPAGETVSPGISTPMVLLTVADLSKMQIQTQVDESDIGQVKLGQQVTFSVDAYPDKTFTGVVSLISEKATIEQNVVYYTVYVDVDSPQGLLFPTMTARVTIDVAESRNTLIVPLTAVKDKNGQKYVLTRVNGRVHRVKVKLGLADDENVEILSGVEDGEQLLIPKARPLQTGMSSGQSWFGNPLHGLGLGGGGSRQ